MVGIDLAGNIGTAAAALAGLLLVFLAAVSTSFHSYDPEDKPAVRDKYHGRALLALIGFFLALAAVPISIWGKAIGSALVVSISAISLIFALIMISIAAVRLVKDIK